jgi:hypothetical protein
MSPFARRLREAVHQPLSVSSSLPSATNTGLRVSTTVTMAGPSLNSVADLAANGFIIGSGTRTDPYLINKVLFTDTVVLGSGGVSDLTGKWIKFTNCRFYGNPGNPTPGSSRCLLANPNAAYFIVEDSTIGPNASLEPTGGTDPAVGGCDKGVFSNVPFEIRRCNVFGCNVQIGMEIDLSATVYTIIQDNYCHDTWSSVGDHTDILNGNFHASRVKILHNYLDGYRTGNSFVTNGIGWYDDPADATGKWQDLTVDQNYFDRSAVMILMTGDTTRGLDPVRVTRNVFVTANASVDVYSGRSPSLQFANVDENGSPLTF